MNYEHAVKTMYEAKPHLIADNTLLWVEIIKDMCNQENITHIDDLLNKFVTREFPSSHTMAATISLVRKRHPEFRPTEEQMDKKMEIQRGHIADYINA